MSATKALESARSPISSLSNKERMQKRNVDRQPKADVQPARSKRTKYIAVACDDCRRRKIKCNGEMPCRRCSQLSLDCLYRLPEETSSPLSLQHMKSMQDNMKTLQRQVDMLRDQLTSFQNQRDSPPESFWLPKEATIRSLSLSQPMPPSLKSLPPFRGSTTSTYCFNDVGLSLKAIGIVDIPEESVDCTELNDTTLCAPSPIRPGENSLLLIDQKEALRLMQIYEEECHLTYPVFDMGELVKHTNYLYSFLQTSDSVEPDLVPKFLMDDEQTTLLKAVLACAMVLEGHGNNELGKSMYASMSHAINTMMATPRTLTSVALLVVTATFHFWMSDESQAWRSIGFAARISFEIGLHRRDTVSSLFPNDADFRSAVRVFWAVYALDRRFSFGTGMPFAIQDSDLDPELPEPDSEFPYLRHITKYNRITSKIWLHATAPQPGISTCEDNVEYLDYQVLHWYGNLPSSLGFDDHDLAAENAVPNRGLRRLRLLMRLRKNQARISIYRVMLHSTTRVRDYHKYAEIVTTIANDTIRIITAVNDTSDLYRSQQVCYNYFIVQAVASLLLAAIRAPMIFNRDAQRTLAAAIDLLEGFKPESLVSRKLSQTIRNMRFFEAKINLLVFGADKDAAVDSAVATMNMSHAFIGNYDSSSTQKMDESEFLTGQIYLDGMSKQTTSSYSERMDDHYIIFDKQPADSSHHNPTENPLNSSSSSFFATIADAAELNRLLDGCL